MSTRKPKTRYDYNRLKQYCDENNIELTKNYNSKEKINRETRIEAKCLNCSGEVKKNFRDFLNSGCFCETCTKQNARLKTRETQLNKYKSVLDKISQNIFFYGKVGSGHSMKLLHNSVCHGIFLMMCEIGHLGEEMGIKLNN